MLLVGIGSKVVIGKESYEVKHIRKDGVTLQGSSGVLKFTLKEFEEMV